MANPELPPNPSRAAGIGYHSRIFVSNPIPLKIKDPEKIQEAELEFRGLYHNKESFEARVFLNNPAADHNTAKIDENGYAGSLYVFAHGTRCMGGAGHCQVKDRSGVYDIRTSHHLKPTDIYLSITQQFKKIIRNTVPKELTITVVPIMMSFDQMADQVNVFHFESFSLLIHGK